MSINNITTKYNLSNPSVKRLMKEACELNEPTDMYYAQPLEDDLYEWHFTIRGPSDTPFSTGIYHGRIVLPQEYPMKPPTIIFLTANGRFKVKEQICLSISGYHPETWLPSWSIRTALLAIIGFMPTKGDGAVGSLDYPSSERKKLAKESIDYICPTCNRCNRTTLKELTEKKKSENKSENLTTTTIDKKEKEIEQKTEKVENNGDAPIIIENKEINEKEAKLEEKNLIRQRKAEILAEARDRFLRIHKNEQQQTNIGTPNKNTFLIDAAIISCIATICFVIARRFYIFWRSTV
ncbi:hypothetical protein SNEBB_001115 [Seison nebaliae]|nr:hypothetical protein SNEBB_001115 [Seison nebaliae]